MKDWNENADICITANVRGSCMHAEQIKALLKPAEFDNDGDDEDDDVND